MKIRLSLMLAGLLLILQATNVWAVQTIFSVSATVPLASGISIVVDSVDSTTNVFTQEPPGFTNLTFDPLTYNTTNNIYVPNHYYALNFSVTGGSGTPDVTSTYTEGANPNGTTNGLGYKVAATFAQEVGSTETILSAHPKTILTNVQGEDVHYTELTQGATLRIYLGVCTGGSSDPAGCQVISNSDAAGTYTGTLTTTAVVN